jgi:hypothetical protein
VRGGGGAVVNYGGDTAASENAKCYTDQTPLSFQHVLVNNESLFLFLNIFFF